MPAWEVSEPYISLWLHDQPMMYNMSIGREFELALDYHQRETRPVGTNSYGSINGWQLFNFGPNWNCNQLTYLDVVDEQNDPTFTNYDATQYCPDGGVRTYSWDGSNPDTRTYTQLQRLTNGSGNLTGFEILYPNGSQAVFGLLALVSSMPEETLAMISKVIDPQGREMQYLYTTNNNLILLTKIIDFDGRTNQFVYGNTNFPTAVTEVIDPYLATVNLKYDTNGVLTNLVDVMDISSSFQYTFTNEVYNYSSGTVTNSVWLLTALQTPYGTTAFSYLDSTAPLFGDVSNTADINRAITVTQPDGGHDLYMYRDDSGYPDNANNNVNPEFNNYPYLDFYGAFSYYAGFPEPGHYNNATIPPDLANFDGHVEATSQGLMRYRNSFFWGPRQYDKLSTTILTNLSTSDYVSARMRHWLHSSDYPSAATVSPTLSMQQESSPDSTNFGETAWYGYPGKLNYFAEGTNDWPDYVGRQINNYACYKGTFGYGQGGHNFDDARLPTGYYTYTLYNSLGYPTNIMTIVEDLTNYYEKTNQYIYASNDIDLLEVIGPNGVTNAAYSYNANHQILTMTNALGEVAYYTYNADGQVTSITQPNGLVTTNVYGNDGFLAQQIVMGYSTNSYTYLDGLIYTHTDPRGLTVTNTWDALQRLTKVAYPDGSLISYIYSNLDLVRVIDRMGFTNSFAYDPMRRLTDQTNALGYDTHYEYCTCGALESIRDASGNITTFTYDLAGRLTNTTYADSFSVNQAYNFYGESLNTSDSSGNSVSNYYDDFMNPATVTNTVGQIAAYAYDVDNRLTNSVDANGVSVAMAYDNLDRILTRKYPDGGVEKYGYTFDVSGPTGYTNQIGNVVTYAYDAMNRKTNEAYVGVATNGFTYNGAGDLLTLTDGKSQNTSWSYDQYGRVTNKIDNAGVTNFIYQYDDDNRLTGRWSADNITTIYGYDAVGNLTNVNYSGGTVYTPPLSFSYDPLNRLINMLDGIGMTTYSYDAAGQMLSEDGPWANDQVSYAYQNRLRTSMGIAAPNMSAWRQTYAYDTARRLKSVASPAGEFDYTYDPAKQREMDQLSLPGGAYISDSYDSVARLSSTALENSANAVLDSESYSYNLAGQRTQQTYAPGNYMNYSYDNAGELVTAQGYESGGAARLQEQLGYAYDAAGNLSYRTNNALIQNFSVNNLNELTTAGHSGTLTVSGTTTEPGNKVTSVTVNGLAASEYADGTFASTNQTVTNAWTTYTALAQDIYGRASSYAVSALFPRFGNYTYDPNGNLVNEHSPIGGTNRIFSYNDENQLVSVYVTNLWREDFVYDGKMRRRIETNSVWQGGAWVATNVVYYLYDGNVVVQERNAMNLPQVTYTRGNDLSGSLQGAGGIGGLLARSDNTMIPRMLISITGQTFFLPFFGTTLYHADGNGNVTMLIYTNQTMAAHYKYDPYGNTLSASGPLASLNVYRFSSKEWSAAAALYYYLYRYYDPLLQRWPNRDPLENLGFETTRNTSIGKKLRSLKIPLREMVELTQGANLYEFVHNDPDDHMDKNGLVEIPMPPDWPGGLFPPKFGNSCTANELKKAILDIANKCHSGGTPSDDDCQTFCDAAYGGNEILTARCMLIQCPSCFKKK